MCRPRYIISLQNGSAEVYHMPSEQVSQEISIPLHSGSAEIYHMPSEWVIYPPPFTAGQLGYIICLQNGSAGIYHLPSEWVSWDISTPLHSNSRLAQIYHMPSERVGQDISHA